MKYTYQMHNAHEYFILTSNILTLRRTERQHQKIFSAAPDHHLHWRGHTPPHTPLLWTPNHSSALGTRPGPTVYNKFTPMNSCDAFLYSVAWPTVWVKKIPPLWFSDIFPIRLGIFNQFLHTYYMFLSTLDCKFLFNYLQLWRSYAILSTTAYRIFTFHYNCNF